MSERRTGIAANPAEAYEDFVVRWQFRRQGKRADEYSGVLDATLRHSIAAAAAAQ